MYVIDIDIDVTIVDISNTVQPFNIQEAAFILRNCFKDFPINTIHIISIDDELNINNEHLAVKAEGHYFIGSDNDYMEDKGFALKPWKKITFGDRNFILKDNIALVMGNYYFHSTNEDEEIKVVYTFGYIRDSNGKPVINLHHSSLPYLSN